MTPSIASKYGGTALVLVSLLGAFTNLREAGAAYQTLAEEIQWALHAGDGKTRTERLNTVAKIYPSSPVPLILLGEEYEKLGKTRSAIDVYEKAVGQKLSCILCHEKLGKLLIKMGQIEEGESHLRDAKQIPEGGES